jgi:hypothetical protein
MSHVVVIFMFHDLLWEVICRFGDIDWIVEHQLFKTFFLNNIA